MQTFLPNESYSISASQLDRQRLGKQRVECWQILRALRGETRGWVNHPAVHMWRSHEAALCKYAVTVCDEWAARGYVDNMGERFRHALRLLEPLTGNPPWLGGPIHASHRAALLFKDPDWYAQFSWTETPGIDYHWPV